MTPSLEEIDIPKGYHYSINTSLDIVGVIRDDRDHGIWTKIYKHENVTHALLFCLDQVSIFIEESVST